MSTTSAVVNIAAHLSEMAARQPDAVAICQPDGRERGGKERPPRPQGQEPKRYRPGEVAPNGIRFR